jgi:hypothetical protein
LQRLRGTRLRRLRRLRLRSTSHQRLRWLPRLQRLRSTIPWLRRLRRVRLRLRTLLGMDGLGQGLCLLAESEAVGRSRPPCRTQAISDDVAMDRSSGPSSIRFDLTGRAKVRVLTS